MLFVVYRLDRPGMAETRQSVRPAHLNYMKSIADRVRAGGPLLADDGATSIGGLMVVEAESRAEVEALVRNDPFEQANLSATIEIRPWRWQSKPPPDLR